MLTFTYLSTKTRTQLSNLSNIACLIIKYSNSTRNLPYVPNDDINPTQLNQVVTKRLKIPLQFFHSIPHMAIKSKTQLI